MTTTMDDATEAAEAAILEKIRLDAAGGMHGAREVKLDGHVNALMSATGCASRYHVQREVWEAVGAVNSLELPFVEARDRAVQRLRRSS